MVIKNNFYLVFFFFLAFNFSCEKKTKVKNTLAKSEQEKNIRQQKRDSIFKLINRERANNFEEKFNYPKAKLFLSFFSGMSKTEFIRVSDSLAEKKVFFRNENLDLNETEAAFSYNVSKIMNWPDQIQYGIDLIPKFDGNDKLLSVKLKNIGLFSVIYSRKYSIPRWPIESVIEVSKIGKYNTSYDPMDHVVSISELEQSKVKKDQFYIPKKQNLPVPESFKDKSKTLDLYETQNYFTREIDSTSVENFRVLININENAVILYEKNWSLRKDVDYSIPFSQIPFEAILRHLNLRERQSKQIIETTYWERNIDVTYTTLEYYNDSIAEPKSLEIKEEDINRNITDEI